MKLEHKTFQAEIKESSATDLTVTHFISSEAPDRGRDILYSGRNAKGEGMVMGGRVVVLQEHGQAQIGNEPIAKPLWIKASKFQGRNGIECKTQFFPDELGKRLWKKTTEGYMPNWSVGWRPLISEVLDGFRHVYEWELMEYSLVSVPMQPDAQTTGKDAGRLCFKILSDEKGLRLSTSTGDEKLTVTIPDNLIENIIQKTVSQHLRRLRGRIED